MKVTLTRVPQRPDDLWDAFHVQREPELRDRLFAHYRELARSVAWRVAGKRDEDLEQVAQVALLRAIDRFDPAVGCQFSTFAVPSIAGELKRHLRDTSYAIRPSRTLHDLCMAVRTTEWELTARSGRPATLAEIAAALDKDLDRVVEAIAMQEVCSPRSLDAYRTDDEGNPFVDGRLSPGAVDEKLEDAAPRIAWQQILERLQPPLRRVIELRYFGNLSQREAALQLGVSQMQVSRLEHRALAHLRADHGPPD